MATAPHTIFHPHHAALVPLRIRYRELLQGHLEAEQEAIASPFSIDLQERHREADERLPTLLTCSSAPAV